MAESCLDQIHIHDLLMRCIIGIYEDERREQQDVCINITLRADLSRACLSDDITDTVDYKTIKKRVIEMVEGSSFFLVERLAQRIADLCLENDAVEEVRVRVAKPGALRFARTVEVDIVRQQQKSA